MVQTSKRCATARRSSKAKAPSCADPSRRREPARPSAPALRCAPARGRVSAGRGNLARDLDALVDRPGMKVKGTGLGARERARVDLVALDVVASDTPDCHALLLHAQAHDCVGVRRADSSESVTDKSGRPAAIRRIEATQPRPRAAEPDMRSGLRQRPDVRPRHARVQDVADDRDLSAARVRRDATPGAPQRKEIEQRLRWMARATRHRH